MKAAGETTQPEETEIAVRLHGKAQKKYRVEVDVVDGKDVPRVVEVPDKRKLNPGRTPEQMARMREILKQKRESGEITDKPGPPRKVTREQAVERALERLEPVALKVLADQIKDKNLDPSDRRAAAVKILEYRRGKPTQALKVDSQQVSTIRFETAAWIPGMEKASAASLETGEVLELPPGAVKEIVEQLADDE